MHTDEINRRKQLAIKKIHELHGTDEGEYGPTLFASHHLDELDASFWQEHLGTSSPDPEQVLKLLELKPIAESDIKEEGDSAFDSLDFTLPSDITDYVLCVKFNSQSEIENVSLES
ncbi:MAG: DUF2004 domain-containing protein [Planctomycetota bacterium]